MEFKKVKLGEIAKFNQKSYKSNYNWKTVKYLDTGNLNKNKVENLTTFNLRKEKLPSRAKRIPQINSILYSTVRPNQEHYGILENKFDNLLVSTGFTVIDIYKENINPKYIYYFLTKKDITAYLQKIAEDSVSTYPAIKPSDIKNLEILLPNRNNQDKIEQILSNLDSKIEINNKIISNLESQAQAIFKSWFVDFEPFQDGDFVESELGMIPEGWEVKELGELYPMKSGYAFKSKDWSDNGFPIIKIKNISNGSIDLLNCDYVNCNETLKKAISFKVTGGEIVIALTGATTGKFGVIPYNTSAYINQRAGLFFDKQEIGYGFLYGLLNQKKFINNIIELSQGSAQSNLSPRDVNSLKFAFDKNISDIFNLLNYYIKKVSELTFQNTKLAELRDALLPKLMAGEIDVSNIKIEREEVKNE